MLQNLAITSSWQEVSDTIVFTVLHSLPFKVLTPAAGSSIVIGSTVEVTWQCLDTTYFQIYLSTDAGRTWETIITKASVHKLFFYVWDVSTQLAPSDSCLIRVKDYFNEYYGYIGGYFSLVRQ